MAMKKKLTAGVTCLAAIAPVSPAAAAILPGIAIDGPSATVGPGLPRIDVAPDGSAALVYLKTVDGEDHPFVSRLVNGAWSPPQQVDPGSNEVSEAPRIAIANGGKTVVTFRSATVVVARVSPSGGAPFGPPQTIQAAGRYGNVDLAPNGNGYVISSDNADVVAWRLDGAAWAQVGAGQLNADPAVNGGDANNHEARVATAPDGASAVAAWGEGDAGSTVETVARRFTGTSPGPAAGAALPALPGAQPYDMGVVAADQPDVGIAASGTAWVVFRQNFIYNNMTKHRAIARPFTGNSFGPYQLVDGMPDPPPEGRDYQRIDVNPAGQGLITHYGNLTNPFEVAALSTGTWTKGALVNTAANNGAPLGSPAIGENGSGLVGWNQDPGGGADKRALGRATLGGLRPELTLSDPAFGSVASGVETAAGAGGFAAAVFVQGAAATTRIVATVVDLPRPAGTPPQSAPRDVTRPRVTGLRLSRRRFRIGRALPSAAAVKTGTTIRFRLSEAARARLSFSRARAGRRAGGRCRRATRQNRGRPRCTRFVSVRRGSFTRSVAAGARRIRFAGRVSRRTTLRPGRYRLTLTATDRAGNRSSPDRARFTLLRRVKPRG